MAAQVKFIETRRDPLSKRLGVAYRMQREARRKGGIVNVPQPAMRKSHEELDESNDFSSLGSMSTTYITRKKSMSASRIPLKLLLQHRTVSRKDPERHERDQR